MQTPLCDEEIVEKHTATGQLMVCFGPIPFDLWLAVWKLAGYVRGVSANRITLGMKKLLIIASLAAGVARVQADEAAFQLSLTPAIAMHPTTTQINGVSLGVWSKNPQHSFTLGFVNGGTGESKGFSWAFFYNYADSYRGVQWALVNYSQTSFVGWQDGWVNYDQGYFKGLESGLVNLAQDAHGLQLGVINYADQLNGVQIGLGNVINSNPWFDAFPDKLAKGFPIVNWSF